nr:protein-S-isoprenylcysteine O-methyltransferase B-like isoform X1 [Tanacetum cinerariifolium]
MSLKQYLGVMKAELLSELLHSSFSEIFSYTASRQLSQMFFAVLFFHGSEYLLAIFFHGKSNVTLSSLLISQQYIMAMFFSVLEYLFELYLFPGLKEHWWISNLGLFMVIGGEIIRKFAIITAGRAFTHLIQRHHEEHHNLVTHGVYNIVRHPGYTGFFIWSVGTQVMLCNPLSTIAFTLVVWNFFHRRIPYEEYFLRQFFGSEYEEYAKVVSSGIPFVNPIINAKTKRHHTSEMHSLNALSVTLTVVSFPGTTTIPYWKEPRNETTLATVKARTYTNLTDEEKIRESVDIKATKIVLQGSPQDIYNLVHHNEDAKQIWDRVKLLIQGSELSLQELESKLYDDFDTFTSMSGEIIHLYYMRFAHLINDMHNIGMTMKPLHYQPQVVTNYLVVHQQPYQAPNLQQSYQAPAIQQPSSTELDSGLVPSFNPFDYPIANLNKLMAFYYLQHSPIAQQYYSPPSPQQSLDVHVVLQRSYETPVFNHPPVVHHPSYQALVIHQSSPVIPQQSQASFPQLDSRLVPSFLPFDGPIASLNKVMTFLSTTFASR